MTDWVADSISCAAFVLAGLTFLDGRRGRRRQEDIAARVAQIEDERRDEELRPRLVVEDMPDERFDDYSFTVRVRSECDRLLHIGEVRLVEDPAAPSALHAMSSHRTSNRVQREDIDTTVQPHGTFQLDLIRNHSLQRTDGTGRITLQVDEPGTGRSWPITIVVKAPWLPGEAPHSETVGDGG